MTEQKRFDLGGSWEMRHFLEGTLVVEKPEDIRNLPVIPAQVPGNYEIDLQNAGEIPDPFIGTNSLLLRPYEFHQFWYEKRFATPDLRKPILVFEGLDCIADIWLNGVKIASTDNALIPHRFEVTDYLKKDGTENELSVCLKSPLNAVREDGFDAWYRGHSYGMEMLRLRKPPHCFGWDIMPRIVSAGIWRPVYLEESAANQVLDLYVATESCNENRASLRCFYHFRTDSLVLQDFKIRISGKCGESTFQMEKRVCFFWDLCLFDIQNPRLWWPRGYGEANLYEAKFEVLRGGEVIASRNFTFGVRTIALDRTDLNTPEHPGKFQFIVNGTPIFVKGSNWVPVDALHSRDAARIPQILALFKDMGCNMLRCWGGNVYEPEIFYDLCDRYGIMVWQDFTMACGAFPQDEDFLARFQKEAEAVVHDRRQHPCIVLWAGDNECDCGSIGWWGNYRDPAKNRLTREILPHVLDRLDGYRPYIPSSPYITPAIVALHSNERIGPEQHLWGARDYYKAPFYSQNNACFASEMGYHGCPAISSLRKMMHPEYVWPWKDNPEWGNHATDPVPGASHQEGRINMMANQIQELFGFIPDNIEDFVLASQFVQAEAKKFFVEIFRQRKPHTSGVLWWNMMDGWPEISDAIVDYYFTKKLAYHFLKRVHRPLCLVMAEPDSWCCRLLVCNDSREDFTGTYRVRKGEAQEIIQEGTFTSKANQNAVLANIRIPRAENELYIMEWEANGEHHVNHYISGTPAFNLDKVKRWLKIICDAEPYTWAPF